MHNEDAAGKIDAITGPRMENLIRWADDKINNAIYEGADQVAGMIGAFFGAVAEKAGGTMKNISDHSKSGLTDKVNHTVPMRTPQVEVAQTKEIPSHAKEAAMSAAKPFHDKVQPQEAHHVDNANLHEVTMSSKTAYMSQGHVQTNSEGRSV